MFCSPVFDEVSLHLENGEDIPAYRTEHRAANRYIKQMQLNGKPYTKSYLTHQAILAGGTLTIVMDSKPSADWGVRPEDRPRSVLK